MANIPVERSAGTPWWLWLLGALLLGALLWFLIGAFGDDDVDDAYVDDAEMVEDVDPVVVAGDMDADVDMALDMSNLYVTRVTGDRTFFVAASDDPNAAETLVILDQEASAAPGIEGQVDINPGQRVSLTGADYGPLGDMDLLNMGIPDADLNAMTADTDVIRADGDEVEILEADMENVEVGE
ncbi:hypothetical protein [Rubrivirga sp. IMCC43871]|uniref:hypothetical protein n=1 Tax=Rubrivirga sp. IMCC43871 TaxID=3391575 RepID=UPI00398FA6C9